MAKKKNPRSGVRKLDKNQLREIHRWEAKALEAERKGKLFEMNDCLRRADKLRNSYLYANERRTRGRK